MCPGTRQGALYTTGLHVHEIAAVQNPICTCHCQQTLLALYSELVHCPDSHIWFCVQTLVSQQTWVHPEHMLSVLNK